VDLEDAKGIMAARRRVDRRSEAYLAEAQSLSHTGSFGWKPSTGEFIWSEETFRIFQYDPTMTPTVELVLQRVHPEDAALVQQTIERAEQDGKDFDHEYRLVMPDSFLKYVHVVAHALRDESAGIEFVGAVMDVTAARQAEKALKESAAYLAEAQRLTHTGSAAWQVAGRSAVNLSEEWYRIYGFDPKEGPSAWEKRLQRMHPEDRAKWGDITDRAIREKADYEGEHRILLADGTLKYTRTVGHPVLNASGDVEQFVCTMMDVTERKVAEAAFASVNRRLIEAQEKERTRIARELHDDIGQRLALLALQLHQLQEDNVILPDVRSRMGEFQEQISEIATDIQFLSHELHSARLQHLGIAGAMRGFCKEFAEQQKVEIDFETYDLLSPLSPDISLCLFRIAQEALHNSAKHSGVRQFEVRLWGSSDEIHLTVKDSGAGFDREAARESRGLGLISMEERLKLVKGTLSIDSQPKRGTTIHARVPLSSRGDSARAAVRNGGFPTEISKDSHPE
jgi:PAS domain S-box-containing protein